MPTVAIEPTWHPTLEDGWLFYECLQTLLSQDSYEVNNFLEKLTHKICNEAAV